MSCVTRFQSFPFVLRFRFGFKKNRIWFLEKLFGFKKNYLVLRNIDFFLRKTDSFFRKITEDLKSQELQSVSTHISQSKILSKKRYKYGRARLVEGPAPSSFAIIMVTDAALVLGKSNNCSLRVLSFICNRLTETKQSLSMEKRTIRIGRETNVASSRITSQQKSSAAHRDLLFLTRSSSGPSRTRTSGRHGCYQ